MDAALLTGMFGLNYDVLRKNLDGITHSESLRSPSLGGNNLNWVLGHIGATRNVALSLLGAAPTWDAQRAAQYSGAPGTWSPDRAVDLREVEKSLDRSQEQLVAALTSATSQVMDADAGIGTVREALAVLQFHEAYHAGQVGLLRRLLGKPGVIKPPQQPPRRQSALA